MPLKIVWRNGIAYVRGTVRGQRCYETTGTSNEDLAEAYRAKKEAELYEASVFGARAAVSFQRAALSYLDHQERSETTKFHVGRLVAHFTTTPVGKINQDAADEAVKKIVGLDAAPATKRRGVYGPLTAVLNHASKREWCAPPKFDVPRPTKGKTDWLTPRRALRLIESAAAHLSPLVHFTMCVGPRLAEALELDWERDVDLPAAKVVFRDTKNGKDRVARLTPAAVVLLANMPYTDEERKVREGAVFRTDDGEPYADRERLGGGQIKTAWRTACRRAGLIRWEEDQTKTADETLEMADGPCTPVRWIPLITPHGLRHTWATWFYAASKDALLLKDEGGWETAAMVERYAHLMPSEMVAEIALVWGASHPRIGKLPGAEDRPTAIMRKK